MMWSKHSRRIDPINRSAKPFCQGEAGAVGLSRMPMARSHVFTLSHVAEMLAEDEEWLFEVAEEMDTEDGQLWVVGVGEDGVMAFTDDGIENLKELIEIHKETPGIIEKRRQALAAMMKPKTEESDEI
jgi:hypothetical protein